MSKRQAEDRQLHMLRSGISILKRIASTVGGCMSMLVSSFLAFYSFIFVTWFLSLPIYFVLLLVIDETRAINYTILISLLLTSVLTLYSLRRRFLGKISIIDYFYSRYSYREQVEYHKRKKASEQFEPYSVTQITQLPDTESIQNLTMYDGEIPDDAFSDQQAKRI